MHELVLSSKSLFYSRMQVIKKASQKTIAKRSRLKAFTKVVNYNHIMPTRYSHCSFTLSRSGGRVRLDTVLELVVDAAFEITAVYFTVAPLLNPSLTLFVRLIHGRPKESWKFRWQHPYCWAQSDSSISYILRL